MVLAVETVVVGEVDVRSQVEKNVGTDQQSRVAERRLRLRFAGHHFGHEEKSLDLSVDRSSLVAAGVLQVDLHHAAVLRRHSVEVVSRFVAVEPRALVETATLHVRLGCPLYAP